MPAVVVFVSRRRGKLKKKIRKIRRQSHFQSTRSYVLLLLYRPAPPPGDRVANPQAVGDAANSRLPSALNFSPRLYSPRRVRRGLMCPTRSGRRYARPCTTIRADLTRRRRKESPARPGTIGRRKPRGRPSSNMDAARRPSRIVPDGRKPEETRGK